MALSDPPPVPVVPPLPWLDPFLPPALRVGAGVEPDASDPPSAREVRRARVVVVEALIGGGALLAVALGLLADGQPWIRTGVMLLAAVAMGGVLAFVRAGGASSAGAAGVVATLVVTVLVQAGIDAGVRDPTLMLLLLTPLAAAIGSGPRLAAVTFLAGLVGVAGLSALGQTGFRPLAPTPDDALAVWTLGLLAGGGLLSLLAGVLYARHSEASLVVAAAEAARLQGSLDESEARYRSLVERVPVGIYRAAPDGRLLLANPALTALLGAPDGALAGEADGEPPLAMSERFAASRATFRTAVERASVAGTVEAHVTRADGARRIVRLEGRAVRDDDGHLLYHEGLLEDVTEARATRTALERSEARFRALVQRSSDVTVVLDADARVTYISPAVEALLGVAPEDVVGQTGLNWVRPEDHATILDAFSRTATSGGAPVAGELRLRRADGEEVYADGVAVALFDDPAVGGIVLNLRDASERRRAQAVLVRAKQHAEEVAHVKTTFLANMSHEIRTPLTSILGYADVLSADVADPEQREYVDRIAEGGRRLMETLNSVLDLARFEAGRGDLVLAPMSVPDAVAEAGRLLKPEADRRGLALESVVEAPGATAALDEAAFARVLHNLVGNALKFTPDGGRVTLTVTADAAQVYVEVRDTGIGIAPEFLPRVFGEFEQASSGFARTHEGAGLGLSIARQLVERMGGTIAVESEPGRGTSFIVALPRVGADEPPPDERPLALVVDDNEQARLVTGRVLEGRFRIVKAATGEEALEIAAREPIDLAVLDIHLGAGADGTEVMRRLRRMTGREGLPIVAVTAFGLTGDRARYLAMGFDEYVPKPFTRDALLSAVAEACDRVKA